MKRFFLLICLYLISVLIPGIFLYQSDRDFFEQIQSYQHDYQLYIPEAETLLDVNKASAAKLAHLPGVSRPLADQIVEYRKKNGNFSEVSDLSACMPERLLSEISELLCCETEPCSEVITETVIILETEPDSEIITEPVTETQPVTEIIDITDPSVIPEPETIAFIMTDPPTEILFPLELNQASAEELCAIPGIGSVTAEAIITYRDEYGGFLNCQELLNVPGIGEIKLSAILPYIYLETEYFPESEEVTDPTESPQEVTPEIPMINLNIATKEDLLCLPGCNDALADEIIKLRDEEIHIFHNILELTLAEHVTTNLFLSWEQYLCVDDDGSTQIPFVRPLG